MAKEAVFTLKLEPELRAAFMANAAEVDRPASQILRELMKDYLRLQDEEKRSHNKFLRKKVEKSRRSFAEGKWSTHENVEAESAVRRAALQRRVDETDS